MNNTKYFVEGKSLRQCCLERGIKYITVLWRIYEKKMTPEQALNYQRPVMNAWERKKRKLANERRRRYHIDTKYLELPTKFIKQLGYDKQSKYFYKGMRLGKWCENNDVSYWTIVKRIQRHKLTVKEAIEAPWIRHPDYRVKGLKEQ